MKLAKALMVEQSCRICGTLFMALQTRVARGLSSCCSLGCATETGRQGYTAKMAATVERRFWSKVAKAGEDDCWLWTASRDERGYGMVRYQGNTRRAHRVSYALTHGGALPLECVCHSCDRPPCCNPTHLWLGSRSDNAKDMVAKGRQNDIKRANNPNAKLSEADVLAIRASRGPRNIPAAEYSVTPTTITHIRTGKTWRHIP